MMIQEKAEQVANSMVQHRHTDQFLLVNVPVATIEELFVKYPRLYFPPNGESRIGRRQEFVDFVDTGADVESPFVFIGEDSTGLNVRFMNGRHRFSVLRDAGAQRINVTMGQTSVNRLKRAGVDVRMAKAS